MEIMAEKIKDAPLEIILELIQRFEDVEVAQARSYIKNARATGVTQNVWRYEPFSYNAISSALTCLIKRTDLPEDKIQVIEKMKSFWEKETFLLQEGFYKGKHINGIKEE